METSFENDRRNSRLAAGLFLFVCIPMALWGQMFIPSKIFVAQDPVATANNLLAKELLFRTSIVMNLVGIFVFTFMTMLFYRIFKPVNNHLALLMILPIIAQIGITFMLECVNFAAVLILKSEPRPGFDVAQQQETVYLLMRLYRAVMSCDKILFGLSIIPWGMLVWRSNLMPGVFGIFLVISGIGYLLDTTTGILLDRSIVVIIRPYLRGMFLGYMITMIWLLVKGVERRATAGPI